MPVAYSGGDDSKIFIPLRKIWLNREAAGRGDTVDIEVGSRILIMWPLDRVPAPFILRDIMSKGIGRACEVQCKQGPWGYVSRSPWQWPNELKLPSRSFASCWGQCYLTLSHSISLSLTLFLSHFFPKKDIMLFCPAAGALGWTAFLLELLDCWVAEVVAVVVDDEGFLTID